MLIGSYELIRELGRGGMAVVYLARDTRLGRRVAIKFLLGGTRQRVSDFLREGRATAACQHENIVVVYEVDEREGVPYMVLEYLEGHTLRAVVGSRQLPAKRVVELMLPVASALVRAHELNIVHRDLKPENVFLTATGTIKVLDFGIAALFDETTAEMLSRRSSAPPRDSLTPEEVAYYTDDELVETRVGSSSVGTPAYMAPEQFEQGNVDRRADLWACGVMMYEMLAGHHPLQPPTLQALVRNALNTGTPMPSLAAEVPSVPHRLATLVDRCLMKMKEARLSSARELLSELEMLSVSRSASRQATDESPFPGLSAFQETEADRFFGRGPDVLRVIGRLRETSLAAIVGPSGVGKSSFVRAGVIPGLKASGEHWEAFILRPGRQPLQSIATILQGLTGNTAPIADHVGEHEGTVSRLRREPGFLGAMLRARAAQSRARILIFVDQFEELYTLVQSQEERAAFLACLAGVADDAAAPLRVLLSLRSDFLDRVGEDKRFADEVARGLVLLQPLGREALREALTAPVEQLGYSFESRQMVDDMVESLASTPGALPLLQFAGSKLWEARDTLRKLLPEARYREMGGVSGVLAQHADQVVNGLTASMRQLTRNLFQRLITADGTRAVVERAELAGLGPASKDLLGLVDHLVQARLLVLQDHGPEETATVELIHESLITGWPLLRRWVEEGRDDSAFREQLRTTAKLWQARGKPPGHLWQGDAMEDARRWRSRHRDVLPPNEQAYLDAVASLATRATRRRRAMVAGIIAALSLVIAGGAVSLLQVRRAERLAVAQANVAGHEAERARNAEAEVKAQLEIVRREQEEKARAQAEVRRNREDLRSLNTDLKVALGRTEAESARAREAAENARRAAASSRALASSLSDSNGRLEQLVQDERERAERLERERGKLATELR